MAKNVIGKGWPFPIRPGPDARVAYLGGPGKIRQSISLILSTAPGERQLLPEFGCGIHDLVFEANTASLRARVQSDVEEALIRWEPRIDVLDVSVETGPQGRNYLLIRIDYRIRADNSLYNLVYPFFLYEGTG